jgi:hypothetical protein
MIFMVTVLRAQNAPVTTAAVVGGAVPGNVNVPLTVTAFNNIGAVSLSIDYDFSVIHFTGGTPNPLMPSFPIGDVDLGNGYHRITMGWFGQSLSLADGSTVMTLHFSYISGNSALIWHDNGPSCEYTDGAYNVLNDIPTSDYYIGGYICGAVATPGPIAGSPVVCPGQEGEIYSIDPVMNATGYSWTCPEGAVIVTGQNTNAITVDFPAGTISGNISVFGFNTCGNGTATVLAVTVYELPVAGAGDDFSIPYGTNTTLNAAPGGSGSYSYHWAPEELLVNPDTASPETVILTTTATFSLTVTNLETYCLNSDEVTVTITGGPLSVNPVALPPKVCRGESSQLYSNAGGGSGNYTYQWTCDPPGVPPWSSGQANPLVSPDSSKHYLLTVYDGYTFISGSSDLAVAALPTATISGGDTICGMNGFTTLQVILTGIPPWSFTYSYGSTSVFITGQQTSPCFITASDPGDYIITAVEDDNCTGSSYGTAIVRKYPVPATPVIVVDGIDMISSACCGNQWYLDDAILPGETGQVCHAYVSGQYFVVVTLNGCSSAPSEAVDVIVGTDEINTGMFSIYPNPARKTVNITIPQNPVGKLKIALCSASGMVLEEFQPAGSANILSLDIGKLSPGLYFLVFSAEGIHSSRKLIVR